MAIKELLREELQNSLHMLKDYQRELEKLPRGSLLKKKRGNQYYYYIVRRIDKKVKVDYAGKACNMPEEQIAEWKRVKDRRAQYRNAVSKLKKQIKYLRSILRGKEDI